ncbi:MAG: ABC transporter substrate-binding protein [Chloroflexota bacterium]|nr:ABC transporter substrate-binding protein [Chloroflexota bacterium]
MTLLHERVSHSGKLRDISEHPFSRRAMLRRASLLGVSATVLAGTGSLTWPGGLVAAYQESQPVHGGVLRVGIPGSAASFDPTTETIMEAIWAMEHIYSNLIRMTPEMELEPELALAWESNEAGDEWTVTLREGVTFHDGSDFTSEDVVATFEHFLDPAAASQYRSNISMIESVEATSPFEVVFHLSSPFAEFPETLSHYQARMLPAGKMDDLARNPIGTGPYRLDSHVPGERTVLKRYDGFYDLEGQAFIDEIQFLAIPEEATKMAALTSGSVELVNEVQPTSLPIVQNAPGIVTTEIITGSHQPIVMDVTQAPFDDPRVREALKLVVAREGLVAVVLQGHGEPAADQVVPPSDPMYGDVAIPSPDLERAQELLAEAGYADGLDLVLHTTPGRAGMLETALTFKDMAAGAGINVEVVSHPVDAYWAEFWKKTPFFVSNWIGRPTAEMMLSQLYMCDSSGTEGKWCNPDFDALIMDARATLDPDARHELLTQAQQLLSEDGPVIVPYFRSYISGASTRLQGFTPHPLRYLDLRRAWLDG